MNWNSTRILMSVVISFLIIQTNAQIIVEAEDAYFSSGIVENEYPGYTGVGFVNTDNAIGEFIEWYLNAADSITDSLGFRYALGKDENRAMQLYINETLIDTIDFDSTWLFTNYRYKSVYARIDSGLNRIKVVALTEGGAPNMDHLRVYADTNPMPYFKVELLNDGNGTAEITPALDSFNYGSRISILATANPGYTFTSWTGDITSIENPVTIAVDKDYSITANFLISIPAFPGAEGFAKSITGGRGGQVIYVTTLADSGPGSLREAIGQSGPRTIVFNVSGIIHLESDLIINNGNLTIAGQTAPGDGICIADQNFKVSTDNVIIRFIRSRLGDVTEQGDDDAFTCRGDNVIIDHCSFSWGIDEVASIYNNSNTVLQWCIVSEGLNLSFHDEGSGFQEHSYGGIWGGHRTSFHHNIITNHKSRFPRFNGARYTTGWDEHVDYRNNTLYNWKDDNIYGGEPSEIDGAKARINVVNNYFKPGPASGDIHFVNVDYNEFGYSYWFINGNHMYNNATLTNNNRVGISGATEAVLDTILMDIPFEYEMETEHSATEAYIHTLAYSGCILPNRDSVDIRLVDEIINRSVASGDGIIDSQSEVGGWPVYEQATPPEDTDSDGMPNSWEGTRGLNPNDPADRNGDDDLDGFTNLEEYLNELVAVYTYILCPTNLTVSLEGNVVTLNWLDNSSDESGFVIERSIGDEFLEIDVTSANTTVYADNLNEYGSYSYRVKARNAHNTSLPTNTGIINYEDPGVGIEQRSEKDVIRVFPNPFNDGFYVEIIASQQGVIDMSMYDISGKLVNSYNRLILESGRNLLKVDNNTLDPGFYNLIIVSEMEANTIKLMRE